MSQEQRDCLRVEPQPSLQEWIRDSRAFEKGRPLGIVDYLERHRLPWYESTHVFPEYPSPDLTFFPKEIKLDRWRTGMEAYFSDLSLTMDRDEPMHATAVRVMGSVLARTIDDYKYPSDWWQALKERWLPKRLLKRYPVKHTIIITKECYPDISLPDHRHYVVVLKRENDMESVLGRLDSEPTREPRGLR